MLLPIINLKLEAISDTHAIIAIELDRMYNNCVIQYKLYDIEHAILADWADLAPLTSRIQTFEFDRIININSVNKHIGSIDFRIKLLCGDIVL